MIYVSNVGTCHTLRGGVGKGNLQEFAEGQRELSLPLGDLPLSSPKVIQVISPQQSVASQNLRSEESEKGREKERGDSCMLSGEMKLR